MTLIRLSVPNSSSMRAGAACSECHGDGTLDQAVEDAEHC